MRLTFILITVVFSRGMADWESETQEGDCPKSPGRGCNESPNPGLLGPAPSAPSVDICKYLQV